MATLLTADGSRRAVSPANGTDFKLKELRAFVGGDIERVALKDGKILIVHEMGKFEGFDENKEATRLFAEAHGHRDIIVGDVLYCNEDEVK